MTRNEVAAADTLVIGNGHRRPAASSRGARQPDAIDAGHLLGAIFAGSPDAVVVADEEGRIILSSPAVLAVFGYYPEELLGEQIEILIPVALQASHRRHRGDFAASPRARQMGSTLELTGRARDGTNVPIDVSLAPVEVLGRTLVAAFVRDATERQRTVNRLRAVNEITSLLLAGRSMEATLAAVANHAAGLVAARESWIVIPGAGTRLVVVTAAGARAKSLVGLELSETSSRSARVMHAGKSEMVTNLSHLPDVPEEIARLGLGPAIYAPLASEDRSVGTLVVARRENDDPFDDLDLALIEVFACATAIALELGSARDELEGLRIIDDEERIARDLHDSVVQELFALGLSLQATSLMTDGPVSERLGDAIDLLDEVIREIRHTIFDVKERSTSRQGLENTLRGLIEEMAAPLGFRPRLRLVGSSQTEVSDDVLHHVLAVLRESLSNISRHAHATRADVVVGLEFNVVSLSVTDDGVGPAGGLSAGDGLFNMAERARKLGGSFTTKARNPIGTVLEWSVPLTSLSASRQRGRAITDRQS